MAKASQNRPFKFGERDRRELIVQDSEVSLVSINDTSGNPIFLGRAKAGEPLTDDKWQIRKLAYDTSEGVTRVTWPQDSDGNASTDYEFIWSSVSDLVITAITQANPGVVTVSDISTLQDGDTIVIQEVVGMTEVNFDGSNTYIVANSAGNTFELQGIDTSAFTAYSSAGIVIYGEVVNHTYS
jgi:hypothetical protein